MRPTLQCALIIQQGRPAQGQASQLASSLASRLRKALQANCKMQERPLPPSPHPPFNLILTRPPPPITHPRYPPITPPLTHPPISAACRTL